MSDLFGRFEPLLLIVVLMFAMFLARRRRHRPVNDVKLIQKEMKERLQSSTAQLDLHQVELHDIARDAHASLQSKLTTLDQMMSESDREIDRLEQLLEELRSLPTPRLAALEPSEDESLSEEEAAQVPTQESDQFIRLMHQAGFSAAEIARGLNLPEAQVRRALGDDDSSARAA